MSSPRLAVAQTTISATSLPAGSSPNNVAVAATRNLWIRDQAIVRQKHAYLGYAPLSNSGTGITVVGVDSRIGDVTSRARVELRGSNLPDAGVFGSVASAGTILVQNNHHVTGAMLPATMTTFLPSSVVTSIPSFPAGLQTINSGSTVTLQAGAHQSYQLNSGATLVLRPGKHSFRSLVVNGGATLKLDDGVEPVEVFLRDSLTMGGTIVEQQSPMTLEGNVRFIVLNGSANVLGRMIGTVIAPNGTITVAQTVSPHRASFFGRDVEVKASAVVEFVPFPSQLITAVELEQVTACKYETVDVLATVRDQSGGTVKVSINGVPGSQATVQYPTVGKHTVLVTATEGALTQTKTVHLQVQDCVSLTPQI